MAAGKTGAAYARRDLGPSFHAYAAGGPRTTTRTRAHRRRSSRAQGMRRCCASARPGTMSPRQLRAITEMGSIRAHFTCAPTIAHSGTLVREGHDRVGAMPSRRGLKPVTAIQMASSTRRAFRPRRELGSIAPGGVAIPHRVQLASSVSTPVYARGELMAEQGRLTEGCPSSNIAGARGTVT